MKAISLWQPWASAIALGFKTHETRHWETLYRGPIAIHAAKKKFVIGRQYCADGEWLDHVSKWATNDSLPYGAVVCTAELVSCKRMPDARPADQLDYLYGNWDEGRFAWRFENLVKLSVPIPYVGRQGLFEVNL